MRVVLAAAGDRFTSLFTTPLANEPGALKHPPAEDEVAAQSGFELIVEPRLTARGARHFVQQVGYRHQTHMNMRAHADALTACCVGVLVAVVTGGT